MTPKTPGRQPGDAFHHAPGAAFRPHGRTTVRADGAVVHVTAEGPFNHEAVDLLSVEMVAQYRRLPPGLRFVNLTEFGGSMVATPEAWEHLASHLARVNDSGLPLVATAWIAAADVEGRSLFMPRAEALFRELGRVFATFATMAEAEAWALEKLKH